MRLTIWLLGREVFSVSTDADEAAEADDVARDLSGGTTASMPMSFGFTGDVRWQENPIPELE